MLATFITTLTPLLMLFFCIAIGFAARTSGILPDNAGGVMSKLEAYIFCPALNFVTMARYCTVQTLGTHAVNLILASCAVGVAIALAIPIASILTRRRRAERGIYRYALTFANSGYMGDPLVLALFGSATLALYKMYTLPLNIATYTWGIAQIMPQDAQGPRNLRTLLCKLCNPPILSLLAGIAVGLSGAGELLPTFFVSSLESLKACLGPVAMLLVGFTVAGYHLPSLLKIREVYIASILRLTLLPALVVAAVWGLKTAASHLFGIPIGHTVLFLCFFTVATPLGLNTVVFPEAYGGDPKPGASMALISHALCVISIPLLFSLMSVLFGAPSF